MKDIEAKRLGNSVKGPEKKYTPLPFNNTEIGNVNDVLQKSCHISNELRSKVIDAMVVYSEKAEGK